MDFQKKEKSTYFSRHNFSILIFNLPKSSLGSSDLPQKNWVQDLKFLEKERKIKNKYQ